MRLRDRFRGTLVGVAVGDCLGAPFEGAPSVSEREWKRLATDEGPLRFTDDTHMTFGVAESLLVHPGFDGAHMATIFERDFANEPWRGYGAGPPEVFSLIRNGVPWDEAAKRLFGGRGSFGNGAAMRVAPVALAAHNDPDEVDRIARASAAITHAHELGMEGAALQAHAVALALAAERGSFDPHGFLAEVERRATSDEFRRRVAALQGLDGAPPEKIAVTVGNGITALESVPAAICCFACRPDSFEEAVECAVRLGGDTDTIAAMTGAISGAYLGERAISESWRTRAEGAGSLARMADAFFGSTESGLSGAGS